MDETTEFVPIFNVKARKIIKDTGSMVSPLIDTKQKAKLHKMAKGKRLAI